MENQVFKVPKVGNILVRRWGMIRWWYIKVSACLCGLITAIQWWPLSSLLHVVVVPERRKGTSPLLQMKILVSVSVSASLNVLRYQYR